MTNKIDSHRTDDETIFFLFHRISKFAFCSVCTDFRLVQLMAANLNRRDTILLRCIVALDGGIDIFHFFFVRNSLDREFVRSFLFSSESIEKVIHSCCIGLLKSCARCHLTVQLDIARF